MYRIVLFALLYVATSASFSQDIGQITKADCFLDDCQFTEDYPNVEFGYVTVPENYTKPNGKRLKIAFAIIKATDPNPKKDAIIEFQGGWGLPSLDRKLEAFTRRFPLNDRDVIMYDYRGSGYSEPELCDWLGIEGWHDLSADLTNEEFDKRQSERYSACLDSLELRKIDYNQYGSNNKAKDAVLLAESLDYESYNLYGISYGTRAIQNFIRAADSSDITIKSAILDSNVAIGNNNHSMTQVYANILNAIFDDCENDSECNQHYPNLKERYLEFIDSLKDQPFTIQAQDGSTFTFNAQEVNAVIHQLLYDYRNYKDVPILIEHFINRNDKAFSNILPRFKQLVHLGYNALGAINFVYDWSLLKEEARLKYEDAETNYQPFLLADGYKEFYFAEDRIRIDSLENIPVTTNTPALFLAGSYDPITPPEWTKKVAEGFTNHYYYEAQKIGHGVSPSKCGAELMRSFLDNPNQEPDTACFDAMDANDIQFRTAYYKNNRISYLASHLTSNRNMLLVLAMIFIVLVSLINCVTYIMSVIKKRYYKRHWLTSASILMVIVLYGLYHYIQLTAFENSILILFGLVKPANGLLFSVPLILLLSVFGILKWKRRKTYHVLNGLSTISIIIFLMIVVSYQLLPNF